MHYHQMLCRLLMLQEDHQMSKTMTLSGRCALLVVLALPYPLCILNLLLCAGLCAVVCPPSPNPHVANFSTSRWGSCQRILTMSCVQSLGSCILMAMRIGPLNWRHRWCWYIFVCSTFSLIVCLCSCTYPCLLVELILFQPACVSSCVFVSLFMFVLVHGCVLFQVLDIVYVCVRVCFRRCVCISAAALYAAVRNDCLCVESGDSGTAVARKSSTSQRVSCELSISE